MPAASAASAMAAAASRRVSPRSRAASARQRARAWSRIRQSQLLTTQSERGLPREEERESERQTQRSREDREIDW